MNQATATFVAARHQLAEAWRSRRWTLRPESLQLELTAACDARCIHCPRQEMDRASLPMPRPLFDRIVDQAEEMRIPRIVPNGYGEILVLKDAAAYLGYIRAKKHRFAISINSNGFRLSDEKIEMFIDHEVELLNVNIDGATAETAERVRPRLQFDQIERNLHRLLELRARRGARHPKLLVGMVVIDVNRHEAEQFVQRWQGVADAVSLNGYSNRVGSLHFTSDDAVPGPSVCEMPFRDMNIWADGKAVLCCNDWNAQHVVGDLNRETLSEVWHGAAFRQARRLHRERRGQEIPLCAKCNNWRKPGLFVKLSV